MSSFLQQEDRRPHRWPALWFLGLLALAVPGSMLAGGPDAWEPLATPVYDSATLRFVPRVEASAWRLSASGPEGFYVRLDSERSAPQLPLAGPGGEALPDGRYTWELRAVAEPSGEGQAPSSAAGTPDLGRLVQWGHFAVAAGVVVAPDPSLRERPAALVPDGATSRAPVPLAPTHGTDVDVYIDGHLCVGGGAMVDHCTGAQSLVFKTILAKEDNIRIFFEDTSGTASFPTNDWEITINDSTNGGGSFFSIKDVDAVTKPFTIEAGAGSNSLWIDENGRVGLGTATPLEQLYVDGNAHVDGNAYVAGDFTAISSREVKDRFGPVDPADVLERLLALPVAEWSFRGDASGARHLGPMAEEFHRLFALGRDGRSVAPLDLSGVAFAAIQGLHRYAVERQTRLLARLAEADAEIEELRGARDELAARLTALEELVWHPSPPASASAD